MICFTSTFVYQKHLTPELTGRGNNAETTQVNDEKYANPRSG
jgi:hypothetical protein